MMLSWNVTHGQSCPILLISVTNVITNFLATQKQIGISLLSTWIRQDLFAIVCF